MTGIAVEAIGVSKRFVMARERRTSLKERFVRGRAPEPKMFWALKDATFTVPKGSSLGLIGHNGSGKSTALKVLVGIYRPTTGTVRVNGSVSALLEVGAGFHPELTGRENIRLNATILGFTNREIDGLMDRIIEFADIGDHIDAPLKHYSSGMGVRLGFAVAVMVRPEVLIVDEVIAVGDEEFQRKCYDYLYDLRRGGTSMIIVSHGMGQITELCDNAVWLEQGEVRALGPSGSTVRAYIDSVNAREAERDQRTREEQTEPSSDATHPRRGSGEIRVTRVEFLGSPSTPGVLETGRPATVRLHYAAQAPVEQVLVGLGFDDASDRIACGMNNTHQPLPCVPAGHGHIDFVADRMLMAEGRYRVRVQVYRHGHVIDAIDDGLSVVVRGPEVEMAGAYLQLGAWDVVPRLDAPSSATGSAGVS
jgi:ABC-2 type transport system ATP-binding protein/lipopolysaccharide transport system ATP-binding protein